MAIVYLNGDFCEEERAFIPANDRGLLYGDGIFETIRLYEGIPFLIEEHVHRLLTSTRELKIQTDLDLPKISGIVKTLVERNSIPNGVVRITLTRGAHSGRLDLSQSGKATVLVSTRQLQPSLSTSLKSIKAVSVQGYGNRHKFARHKTLSYLSYLGAREEAESKGADDAILISETAEVLEATTANIFIVKDKRLFTPPVESGILPGITRKTVIEISHELGIKISETPLQIDDLKSAEEIFLTNSVIEILPVKSVDSMSFDESPHQITKTITDAYRKKVLAYIESNRIADC